MLENFEWEVIVKDKNGKVIARKKGKGDSYLKNHIGFLYILYTNGSYGLVATDGYILDTAPTDLDSITVIASEGEDNHGIILGTGSNPNTPEMYNLQSKISHGDGNNLLHYYSVGVNTPVVEGNTVYFEISRDAKNNGSVDITIYEAGLVVKHPSGKYVMIGRQVISGGITVPAGATLTFKFRPKITV